MRTKIWMSRFLPYLVLLILALPNYAQQPQSSKPLTNSDVTRMVKSGAPESVIVLSIQTNPTDFDVSAEGLIALQKAAVSQKAMTAILTAQKNKQTDVSVSPPGAPPAPGRTIAKPMTPAVSAQSAQPANLAAAQIQQLIKKAGNCIQDAPEISRPGIVMGISSSIQSQLDQQKKTEMTEKVRILAVSTVRSGNVPTGTPIRGAKPTTALTAPTKPFGQSAAPIAAVCTQPRIDTVSGVIHAGQNGASVIFTPIYQWNEYTITGCGFGSQPGSLHLSGPFHGHQVNFSPAAPWTDTAIVAAIDPSVTGEPDQWGTVTLVVSPR